MSIFKKCLSLFLADTEQIPKFYPVLFTGVFLTINAGFINAVYLGSAFNFTVSHVTGLWTRAGIGIASNSLWTTLKAMGAILFFTIGSAIGAAVVGETTFKPVRTYGVALVLESSLLFLTVFIPTNSDLSLTISAFVACTACGLQNGLFFFFFFFLFFFQI